MQQKQEMQDLRESTEKMKIEEKFNDYESTPVPKEVHMSWLSQGTVWIGCGFCLAAISTGGILATGLGFKDMMIAAILGSLILTTIAILVGIVGAKTHLSSSMSSRFCFGTNGAKIFGIVLAISNFGWFAFQADLFGNTVVTLVRETTGQVFSQPVFTVLGALAMMITAIVGYKGIKMLSNVAVPLLFILSLVALGMTFVNIPFSDIIASGPTGVAIPLTVGVGAVVGNFAVGVTLVSDFTRYSGRPKDSVIGCVLGYFIGYLPILLLGAIFTYAYQTWNIVEVMIVNLGFGFLAALVLILAQWTTNDNNLYSSVLGLSNALEGKVPYVRWKLTLIVGLISTVISGIGVQKYYMAFLTILTSTIPAVAGVIVSDFYFMNKEGYEYELIKSGKLPAWKWNAVISWGVAALVGLTMSNPPTGFGIPFMVELSSVIPTPIVGVIVAFIMNCILFPVFNKKKLKRVS